MEQNKLLKHMLVLLVLALLPQAAVAYDFMVDGLCYNRNDDGTSVTVTYQNQPNPGTGYSDLSGGLVIPATVTDNGSTYSVTTIGDNAFLGCSGLTSVTIPNSVTTIGKQAFVLCSGLTSVTIGNSVTSIGEGAFSGCSGLTSVTIPNSVTSINRGAFYHCSGLTSVTIGNSVTSIGEFAFRDCSGLTSVTIGNSVTAIGDYAFDGCSGLTSVTWNAKSCADFSLTNSYYDDYCYPFSSAKTSIKNFVFGDEVEKIPDYLCYQLTGLTSVTIPNSVTSIGGSAFSGCSGINSLTWNAVDCSVRGNMPTGNIETLKIGDMVQTLPDNLANGSKITSVTIPNSVTSIGSWAFGDCSGLTSVTIPNSVTSIGSSAFSGCSGLTSVTWNAKNCTDFSYSSPFSSATSIKNFVFGDEVEKIPAYLCYNLTGLTSVTIPNSVTSIGNLAFSGCSGIKSLTWNAVDCSVRGNMPTGNIETLKIGTMVQTLPDNLANGSKITSVTIPNSVTTIGGSAFRGCSGLTSVTIPSSVTTIGEKAFYTCSGLTSVTIGNSVTSIGYGAFEGCSGLTSVTIGSSVTSIGYGAFSGCSGIKSLTWNAVNCSYNGDMPTGNIETLKIGNMVQTLPDNLANGSKGSLESVVVAIGNSTYDSRDNCNAIIETASNILVAGCKNTIIPNSVTSISSYAFRDCSGLTSVTIPNAVTTIGDYAFWGCTGLTSVTIPNSVTTIGGRAFYGCSGLTSVTIGNSVTGIGDYAFWDCSGIKSLTWNAVNCSYNGDMPKGNIETLKIGNMVQTLPDNLANGSKITSVTIPNSVTSIGGSAFEGCSGIKSLTWNAVDCSVRGNMPTGNIETLKIGDMVQTLPDNLANGSKITSVTIPNSVTSIGSSAFSGCSGLTSVTIPNSVTSIGSSAFSGCSGLTSVTIPNSVTSIGGSAFSGCSGMTSVTIPNSVTTIGDYAFYGCSGLTSVTIPNSVTSIGGGAFSGCSGMTELTIPNSVTAIGYRVFDGCSGLTSVTIPNSVTSIGMWAFSGCSGLTSVTIPNSVTSISSSAFSGCSGLTSVTIPNSVTSIGNWAFENCSGLTAVTWNAKNCTDFNGSPFSSAKTSIKNFLFGDEVEKIPAYLCYNLTGLTSVTIPNSVTTIGGRAFYGCTGMAELNLGQGIDSIGDYAFYNCSNIQSVVLPQSLQRINDYGFYNCSNLADITFLNEDISLGDYVFEGTAWVKNGDGMFYIGTTAYRYRGTMPPGTNFRFRAGTTRIAADCFSGCEGLNSVVIPRTVTSVGVTPFYGCHNLQQITVEAGNPVFDSRNGCNAIIATASNTLIVGCKMSLIPDNVTSIDNYAFYHCTGLTEVTIPNSVTTIGERAFWYCSGLTEVTIGNSVTSIGSSAFYGCSGLTEVTIPASVTTIGSGAFGGCDHLKTLFCLGDIASHGYAFDSNNASGHPMDLRRTVYVPAELVETYKQYSAWNDYWDILPLTDQIVYPTVLQHTRGDSRVQVDVPILLHNQQAVTGVTVDVRLPQTMSVETNAGGQPLVQLDEARRSRTHGVIVTPLGNNTYRIKMSSTTNAAFKGNHGALAHLTADFNRYHASGNDSVVVENIVVTPTSGTAVNLANVAMPVVLDYMVGDADADVVVDIADYAATVAHIMQRPTARFYADAADCDRNTVIDATDLVYVTRYALGNYSTEYRKAPRAVAHEHSAAMWTDETALALAQGETVALDVMVRSDVAVAALQSDLLLPPGLVLVEARLAGEQCKLSLDTATMASGAVRLLAASFGVNDTIAAGQTALMRLSLRATAGYQGGQVVLMDNLLVGTDLSRNELEDITLDAACTSALHGLSGDGQTRLAVRDGKLLVDTPVDGVLRMVDISGRATAMRLLAGHHEIELHAQGLCIFEMNGTQLKTILK